MSIERFTLQARKDMGEFTHTTGINKPSVIEGKVTEAYVARCTTKYPATQCDCGRFNLEWS